jgi:hypothetical protein
MPQRACLGNLATWSEGDWNGDGMFDQEDIVVALQTGTICTDRTWTSNGI